MLFLDLLFNYRPKSLFYFIIATNLKKWEKNRVSIFIIKLYVKI